MTEPKATEISPEHFFAGIEMWRPDSTFYRRALDLGAEQASACFAFLVERDMDKNRHTRVQAIQAVLDGLKSYANREGDEADRNLVNTIYRVDLNYGSRPSRTGITSALPCDAGKVVVAFLQRDEFENGKEARRRAAQRAAREQHPSDAPTTP